MKNLRFIGALLLLFSIFLVVDFSYNMGIIIPKDEGWTVELIEEWIGDTNPIELHKWAIERRTFLFSLLLFGSVTLGFFLLSGVKLK